jgi:mannose-6-phosphate isomerase-like protein (cupin superfamily)
MATDGDCGNVVVPIAAGEPVGRREGPEVNILVSREEVTVTHARYPDGERVAGPHVHRDHTDAFYVIEGELGFVVGQEAETVTLAAGGFLAAPPGVVHSFCTAGEGPARWLTIHAPDGGFGTFMRGIRDDVESEWDISPIPVDGGLPASAAVVSPSAGDEPPGSVDEVGWLRCALPDLRTVEWKGGGQNAEVPLHLLGDQVALLFVVEGELEATFGGSRQAIGPDTLVSVPRDERRKLNCHGRAQVLVITTQFACEQQCAALPKTAEPRLSARELGSA